MIIEKQKMLQLLNIIKNDLIKENINLNQEDFMNPEKILQNILDIKFPINKLYGFLYSFWILKDINVNFEEKFEYFIHRFNIEDDIIDFNKVIIIKKKKSINFLKNKQCVNKIKIEKNYILMSKTNDCPEEIDQKVLKRNSKKEKSKKNLKRKYKQENFDNYFQNEHRRSLNRKTDRTIRKKSQKNINFQKFIESEFFENPNLDDFQIRTSKEVSFLEDDVQISVNLDKDEQKNKRELYLSDLDYKTKKYFGSNDLSEIGEVTERNSSIDNLNIKKKYILKRKAKFDNIRVYKNDFNLKKIIFKKFKKPISKLSKKKKLKNNKKNFLRHRKNKSTQFHLIDVQDNKILKKKSNSHKKLSFNNSIRKSLDRSSKKKDILTPLGNFLKKTKKKIRSKKYSLFDIKKKSKAKNYHLPLQKKINFTKKFNKDSFTLKKNKKNKKSKRVVYSNNIFRRVEFSRERKNNIFKKYKTSDSLDILKKINKYS